MNYIIENLTWLLPILITGGGGSVVVTAFLAITIYRKMYLAQVKDKESEGDNKLADAYVKQQQANKLKVESLILEDERESKYQQITLKQIEQVIHKVEEQTTIIEIQREELSKLKATVTQSIELVTSKDLQIERLVGINQELRLQSKRLEEYWLQTLEKLNKSENDHKDTLNVRREREETIKKLEERVLKLEEIVRKMGVDPKKI